MIKLSILRNTMAMKENKAEKNYTIGEVSRLLNVKEHTIRYWETEFSALNPKKTDSGRRQYDLEDLKLLQKIKKLLYQDLYSIKGALKELEKESEKEPAKLPEKKEEKSVQIKEQNLKSVAEQQNYPNKNLESKLQKEFLMQIYQEVENLITLWEGLPTYDEED